MRGRAQPAYRRPPAAANQLLSEAITAVQQRLVAAAHLGACSRARGSRMAGGGREEMSERGARLGEAVWTGSDTI